MLDKKRESFKEEEKKIGRIFNHLGISPNQWTLISVLAGLISLYFIVKQYFIFAIVFFLISGFADYLNGIIARHRDVYTKLFRYFDTVSDRYVDGIVLFGMLFLPLPNILFPGYVWIFLLLFGSLTTAFVKAAAKEKELVIKELKGGLITRAERILLISIALFLGTIDASFVWTTYLLIFLVIITNFTALQRIFSAVRAEGKQ
ncbi:MAG: CDP-alcohol phosphatidyltransferase family protein [Candidatus Paceibacterota bacterium]